MRPLLALDTEDDSNGHVRIINFFDGLTHTTFTGRNTRERAWAYLVAHGPASVWACNLEYDLINVFGPWLGKLCTLQYVRSGIMRASFAEAYGVTFYDTLRHWPISVEGMGEHLGLPKLPTDFQSVAYCQRDTEIVWRFVSLMVARYDALHLVVRATLPSMALQLWRHKTRRNDPTLPQPIQDFFREGYYGGRVEVYRFGEVGPLNHYDINSLFPSVMADQEFPDLEEWHETKRVDLSKEGMAHVDCEIVEDRYPSLPYRHREGMLYPYGRAQGTWTYPELRQCVREGGKILRVFRAIEFRIRCHPFRTFVRFCYDRRTHAVGDLDRAFWKLMMNSLYGKFGQGSGLDIISHDRHFTLTTQAAHVNVIWSAYVTAYARLRLLKELRACSEVYYTDTDSLFTPDVLPVGTGLGTMRLEGRYATASFVGNKLYTAANPIKVIVKAKGVKRTAASDFIRTGRAVFRQPARYRASLRRGLVPNKWYLTRKVLRAEYIKRRILSDGRTEPWDLKEFLRLHG